MWEIAISQSESADETRHSFDRQFYSSESFFFSTNSRSPKGPYWSYMSLIVHEWGRKRLRWIFQTRGRHLYPTFYQWAEYSLYWRQINWVFWSCLGKTECLQLKIARETQKSPTTEMLTVGLPSDSSALAAAFHPSPRPKSSLSAICLILAQTHSYPWRATTLPVKEMSV